MAIEATPNTEEPTMEPALFLLRTDTIRWVLARNHLTHQRFADHLGLSRSYWSQIFNRHRHLTPTMRQILLASRYLRGLGEEELWEVVPSDAHQAGAPNAQQGEARP
jgi:transcriptional regulator with XRE-family HTH domain